MGLSDCLWMPRASVPEVPGVRIGTVASLALRHYARAVSTRRVVLALLVVASACLGLAAAYADGSWRALGSTCSQRQSGSRSWCCSSTCSLSGARRASAMPGGDRARALGAQLRRLRASSTTISASVPRASASSYVRWARSSKAWSTTFAGEADVTRVRIRGNHQTDPGERGAARLGAARVCRLLPRAV